MLKVTIDQAETFERCMAVGGVALFPADTVYGLATDPDSREGVERLYALKGRPPARPAAVMFFSADLALAALSELGPRTRAAVAALLPGALTLVLPNPARRFPLACGPYPEQVGLRVPALSKELAALASVRWPVLQSSANVSGAPDARRYEDVDRAIRSGVDLGIDGGELPGTASTVVDLTAWEDSGEYRILRAGAVSATTLAATLNRP